RAPQLGAVGHQPPRQRQRLGAGLAADHVVAGPQQVREDQRIGRDQATGDHCAAAASGARFMNAARWQMQTISPRWLMPRCSKSTMPAVGRLFDTRLDLTVVSTRMVSPANTGLGKLTSFMPRLPM